MIRKSIGAALAFSAVLMVAGAKSASAGSDSGNFMVRLQGTYLSTDDKTKSLTSSALGDVKALGYSADTESRLLPTATLTYFFNKNIAAELFCCAAATDINLKFNGAKVGEIAETWMFPPIVTLQYHVTGLGAFKPYIGAGFQYIHFFNSKLGDNTLGATKVSLSDSFGPALQLGFDYHLGNGWYLNADVKKTWLDTKVKFANATTLGLANVAAKHDLDPWTVSVGVGYRFNLEDLFGNRSAPSLK